VRVHTIIAGYDPHSLPPACVSYFMWFKQVQLEASYLRQGRCFFLR